jgi:hypothetical protein
MGVPLPWLRELHSYLAFQKLNLNETEQIKRLSERQC